MSSESPKVAVLVSQISLATHAYCLCLFMLVHTNTIGTCTEE